MLQLADNRRRFVMPKEAAIGPNEPAEVEVLPDGRVMISPVRIIPVHELWAVTPESTLQTEAALRDYRAGRTQGVKSLDDRIAAKGRKKARK
ncbi:MAG: AbrB/MazE/SpoVT family DNA-binding domain-containing protein [Thermoanaerobaculia bacterium]